MTLSGVNSHLSCELEIADVKMLGRHFSVRETKKKNCNVHIIWIVVHKDMLRVE